MKVIHAITILCFLVLGCSADAALEDRFDPVYPKFPDAAVVVIDVDGVETDELRPGQFEKLIFESEEGLFYDSGGKFAILGNRLFQVSRHGNYLIERDLENLKSIATHSFTGRGPGEYELIMDIYSDGEYLFLLDNNQAKIIQYSETLDHVNDLFLDGLPTSLPPSNVFSVHDENVIAPVAADLNYLFQLRSLNTEEDINHRFHNRIITLGKQPMAYNTFMVDRNETGSMVLISQNMPLIFVYDQNKEPSTILRLKGRKIDAYETDASSDTISGAAGIVTSGDALLNPPPIEIEREGVRVRLDAFFFVSSAYFGDRLLVRFSNRYSESNMFILLKYENNEWIHTNSFTLKDDDGDRIATSSIVYNDGWIYSASAFRDDIIRINVAEYLSN